MPRISKLPPEPPLCLAAMIYTGTLSYTLLVLYGVSMAPIGAFVSPARDSLLSHVAAKNRPGGQGERACVQSGPIGR